jgi:hypothetical protein
MPLSLVKEAHYTVISGKREYQNTQHSFIPRVVLLNQWLIGAAVGNTKSFAELLERELIIIGGPQRCIRLIQQLERWGVRRLLAIFNYGGMPSQLVMRSMERLAREVMPAIVTASPGRGARVSTELRE